MPDITQYKRKPNAGEQLRHVDATPLVINHMQEAVNTAVQHLFVEMTRAANVIRDQEREIKLLRATLKKSGIFLPKQGKKGASA